jgi:DNA-directed RNA polymerase subunit M/transcription elongation factor TFIIS
MNSQHAYDMIKQDLIDSIENAKKDSEEKTALKELKTSQAAQATKQLAATKDMKAANEKSLADTKTECAEKEMSFQEKQNLRTEEIEAINKAIEILSSPEVLGNAEKYLELVQQGKAKSLALIQAQGSRVVSKSEGVRSHVRRFLMEEGQRLKSTQLVLLAQQLGTDPFAKVKGLIDAMITRLEEETKADADHEGYCDTELGKSKITRTRLSEEIDAYEAAIEEGKANIMALSDHTKTLSQEVADLFKSMSEATELKKQETATNAKTVEDAKASQQAVEAATAVLKAFYEKALTATALVQGKGQAKAGMHQRAAGIDRAWGISKTIKMGSEEWNALANPNYGGVYDASADTGGEAGRVDPGHMEGMQTFGATYQGQQDESDYGVLPMLEVIHSEFANLEADTVAAEDAAMSAYKAFMIESKKNKAVKDKKIEMNTADQTAAEAKLQQDITDLKATQDELLAADRYHAILVPKCFDKGQTFDERQKSRQDEVDSLKQALHILNSEDISTSA